MVKHAPGNVRCLEQFGEQILTRSFTARDPFETTCLPQRALLAAIEVRGQSISAPLRLAAPRVEDHNFDSSNCCRSPNHIFARSASSLLASSALPRAL